MTSLKHIETPADYAEYERRVAEWLELNSTHAVTRTDPEDEGHFSWSACDICSVPLGGTRYNGRFYDSTAKEIYEVSFCPDCEYFIEYGQLDDMTMLKLKEVSEMTVPA